jgi:hypothetical protein
MTGTSSPTREELANLQDAHPRWSIWVSDGGILYAVRAEVLSDRALWHGCAQTVYADDPGSLRARLDEQRQAEERAVADTGSLTARPRAALAGA